MGADQPLDGVDQPLEDTLGNDHPRAKKNRFLDSVLKLGVIIRLHFQGTQRRKKKR